MSLVTSFNNMTRDLQEYKKNLVRAERIAAWRDVARRIAHDIKNPLTPMTIAIYRLKKRLGDDGKDSEVVGECLDSILREVEVLKNMAQEFSTFAKLPEPRLAETDLNQTVRSILELYSSGMDGVDVKPTYAQGLPSALADADQLRRVIGNIVKNAVEAMEGKGSLTITTGMVGGSAGDESTGAPRARGEASDRSEAAQAGPGTGADRMVRVTISDTGPGIPEDMRERIFDPYFTTKKGGTGLGLAMAYRIIQDHGGRITVSTGSDGTTFDIDLRAAGGPAAGPPEVIN
jgi:nitrogen fixation/metabolism regulation signal transduction histidine kinase